MAADLQLNQKEKETLKMMEDKMSGLLSPEKLMDNYTEWAQDYTKVSYLKFVY